MRGPQTCRNFRTSHSIESIYSTESIHSIHSIRSNHSNRSRLVGQVKKVRLILNLTAAAARFCGTASFARLRRFSAAPVKGDVDVRAFFERQVDRAVVAGGLELGGDGRVELRRGMNCHGERLQAVIAQVEGRFRPGAGEVDLPSFRRFAQHGENAGSESQRHQVDGSRFLSAGGAAPANAHRQPEIAMNARRMDHTDRARHEYPFLHSSASVMQLDDLVY